jgi:hypothetical protein
MTVAVFSAIFVLLIIAGGLWGVDSRPGFCDGRTDRKVRFFWHSKND